MAISEHLVAFTFKDFSHFLPTIQLCTILAKKRNIHTTLVIDQVSIKKIHETELIPEDLRNSVPGIELFQYNVCPETQHDYFDEMKRVAAEAVTEISAKLPVTGFLFETFGAHAFEQCQQFNLPHYVFFSINALATTLRVALDFYPKWSEEQPELPALLSSDICKAAIEDVKLMHWLNKRFRGGLKPKEETKPQEPARKEFVMPSNTWLVQADAMKTAKAILVNSFDEFESKDPFRVLLGHPDIKCQFKLIGPVGLYDEIKPRDNVDHPILTWLGQRKEGSVLYIAHGSHLQIKDEEVPEMEMALKDLGIPFVWSLTGEKQGFLKDKSLCVKPGAAACDQVGIITTWSPQVAILEHKSTGAFLSHVGWNSMLEALNAGVPIIAWPIWAEQFINASMVSAKGMGILVEGTGKASDTFVKCNDIKHAILQVLPNDVESPFKQKMLHFQAEIRKAVQPGGKSFNTIRDL
ncbi:hypothetical protein HDV01_001355 [Terramyces sp. JEL0728]|nr:hypothetical protein HDV01_001355 [Terramyces sp. JEL0728]